MAEIETNVLGRNPRIGFFTPGFLGYKLNKGICTEVFALAEQLSQKCDLIVYTDGDKDDVINFQLPFRVKTFKWQQELILPSSLKVSIIADNIDLFHIHGYMILRSYALSVFLRKIGIQYIVSTYSQLTPGMFLGDIFRERSDIDYMKSEKRKQSTQRMLVKKLLDIDSVIRKKFFVKTLGRKMINNASGLHYLSRYEKQRVNSLYNIHPSHKEEIIPWAILNPKNLQKDPSGKNFYLENGFCTRGENSIVYWGRLDVKYKGLDRILFSVEELLETSKKLNFKIFFMGPDYNDGEQWLRNQIRKKDLGNYLLLVDESFWRNTHEPLYDADFLIYPSKWDGFPRSVREAFYYGVPCIASEETHSGDIINRFDCGFTISSKNAVRDLVRILCKLNNREFDLNRLKSNARNAANFINMKNIGERMYLFYKSFLR